MKKHTMISTDDKMAFEQVQHLSLLKSDEKTRNRKDIPQYSKGCL